MIGKTLSSRILRAIPLVFFLLTVVPAGAGSTARDAAGGGSDPATEPLTNYHKVWERRIPISGEPVTTPALGRGGPSTYRLVVSGTVDTGRYGVILDGRFYTDQAREFRLRHDHLRFEPETLRVVSSNRVKHQHVFGFSEEFSPARKRVRVRFEGLAYRFRISPDRLRKACVSSLKVSLWKHGPAPKRWRGWIYALCGGAAALLLVAAFLVLRGKRFRRGG